MAAGTDLTAPSEGTPTVLLRPMERGDLAHLLRWLLDAEVARWFPGPSGEPLSLAHVEAEYGPRLEPISPIRMWVVEANGRSVGFVQDYRIRDHPDGGAHQPPPDAVAVDYGIGEPAWRGRGIGALMLTEWFRLARWHHPDAPAYFAAVDHRNRASRRLLRGVGFVEGLWFDQPRPDGGTVTLVGHLRAPEVVG
ncbi:GNAT family N-acetyltransferase [Nocardioides sambongensis]|uniref:GNAT family N-acetyltransferase n=1 Tax=Nocardioides sambongensis TaxID=2589074 RepID=UPI00112C1029|nr:GNAT family N-acetyltransferase [Nocardioides sambongensis]